MNGAALLDVNVLVSLFDPDHVHHEIAHDWFSQNGQERWATCPLTENGFLRTANAARSADLVPLPELIDHLQRFRWSGGHEFWPDDATLLDADLFNRQQIRGRRQLTDVYLLGLAMKRRGRFVTFDRHVQLTAVKGAGPENLIVL